MRWQIIFLIHIFNSHGGGLSLRPWIHDWFVTSLIEVKLTFGIALISLPIKILGGLFYPFKGNVKANVELGKLDNSYNLRIQKNNFFTWAQGFSSVNPPDSSRFPNVNLLNLIWLVLMNWWGHWHLIGLCRGGDNCLENFEDSQDVNHWYVFSFLIW